ncbi:MAG: aspartyl-phosphate phosphatase Spo0E family protein [Clostridia bacterium]|nr:aspartyl-phosphate phosphatase Spo0E family protein [Clostridia bacterium]MDD4048776.1 aspartyl-phosphate phosphatase Spo0E family protein [Clostridia bacterium]
MGQEKHLEIARNILNNAASMNMNKETILKISKKMDEYIVEYYRKVNSSTETK